MPRAAVDDLVLRPATAADIAAVARCSRAAYGKYLARLGYEPKPMAADYRALAVDHALWVLSDGSAFYAALGYRETARRPHPRVAGSTLVFMSKALPAGPD